MIYLYTKICLHTFFVNLTNILGLANPDSSVGVLVPDTQAYTVFQVMRVLLAQPKFCKTIFSQSYINHFNKTFLNHPFLVITASNNQRLSPSTRRLYRTTWTCLGQGGYHWQVWAGGYLYQDQDSKIYSR